MTDQDKHIELLERRANVIRSRLLRTVDALDTRRHQVTDAAEDVVNAAPRVGLSALGVVAVSAGSFLALRHYLRSRRERLFVNRLKSFFGGIGIVRIEKKPSFFASAAQKLATTALTVAASELMKIVALNAFDGRLPDGRLVVGEALHSKV